MPLTYFEEKTFIKNNLESLSDCQNAFCTQFELYIFAEMTSLSGLTKDKKSNVT